MRLHVSMDGSTHGAQREGSWPVGRRCGQEVSGCSAVPEGSAGWPGCPGAPEAELPAGGVCVSATGCG